MASVMKVIFQINTSQGSRIKQISMHPIKDWVGIINQNNTFSLWNYQQKILIKSFSCNTLDDNKQVQIKQIVYFDKYSLCSAQDCRSMKNNIIFVTNSKLIFYDYITDAIRQTSEKDLDQKNIRKVCIYSQTKICIAMSDGNFKVLDTKQSQIKGSMSIRTVRGFHVKPINWIFAYSQNYNQMPRVITASDQDGLMACWNIDVILKTPNQQIATPSFKFQSSNKKSKQSITNEQIASLQYDPSSYKLITVNQSVIRFWSTMTGMQIKRIKNTNKYKQLIFFNHFTYAPQSFVAYSKNSRLMVIQVQNNDIITSQQIQLKNFFPSFYNNAPNQQAAINHIYSLPQHSSHIFLTTSFNMAVIELDKFYSCCFGVHNSFSTKLSTINAREFINKSEGDFRKNITVDQVKNIKFQDDILINMFYLSTEQDNIYFNLLEIQYNTMLYEMRRFKFHNFDSSSLFHAAQMRSAILISFQGNQIIVFNRLLCYYQIYQSHDVLQAKDLLNNTAEVENRIDFYSKLQLIGFGYCRDIIYHQYKRQYAIIAGYDDKDRMIEHKRVAYKKGQPIKIQGQPTKFRVVIYEKSKKGYVAVQKSNAFSAKVFKLYSFGSYYGYSNIKDNHQFIDFISSQKGAFKQIEGSLNSCEQVYVSYCESYYVLSYDKYFIVLKIQQNGVLSYFRTFEYTILHGYFWQKFFFFLTENALYFLQILNDESIVIKIAGNSNINMIQKIITDIQDDDFEPQCQILPVGQLQIATIVNMSLVLLNQNGTSFLVNLNSFPYIVFCLQISSGGTNSSSTMYKNASKNIANAMKQTMSNYGLMASSL